MLGRQFPVLDSVGQAESVGKAFSDSGLSRVWLSQRTDRGYPVAGWVTGCYATNQSAVLRNLFTAPIVRDPQHPRVPRLYVCVEADAEPVGEGAG